MKYFGVIDVQPTKALTNLRVLLNPLPQRAHNGIILQIYFLTNPHDNIIYLKTIDIFELLTANLLK